MSTLFLPVSVLFSEPKIPQTGLFRNRALVGVGFSALQRAENSSNCRSGNKCAGRCARVSVLFSEPKIPQTYRIWEGERTFLRFSALQRAENSSNDAVPACVGVGLWGFSALQRAENSSNVALDTAVQVVACFSALQRAENSSNRRAVRQLPSLRRASFSALQRAENSSNLDCDLRRPRSGNGFSALQRAENSSKSAVAALPQSRACVSVLFSEPKIPQTTRMIS